MKYICLLRGINVGGNNKVEMGRLRALYESLGLREVETYINSGNIRFSTERNRDEILPLLEKGFEREFSLTVPHLVKSADEIAAIARAIPESWMNDGEQKTDVAYLFGEQDSEEILEKLPVKRDYINLLYEAGAIIWNVRRENVGKSQLTKMMGTKIYRAMTVRNVNTARFLARW